MPAQACVYEIMLTITFTKVHNISNMFTLCVHCHSNYWYRIMPQNVVYAELGLPMASTSQPPPLQNDKVQYAVVKSLPRPAAVKQDVGKTIHACLSYM